MFSSEQIAGFRSIIEGALYTDTCQVMRKTTAADGSGGTTDTWALIGSAFDCHVRPGNIPEREALQAGRLSEIGSWLVRVPVTTDVEAKDTLAVTTTRGGFGLDVTGVRAPHSIDLSKQLECTELT